MRSLFEYLGLRPAGPQSSDTDSASIAAIGKALDALGPEQARHLAAFAYLLGRVANADLDISDDETRAMQTIVRESSGLPQEQADLAVAIAQSQNRGVGGTEDFKVARVFKKISTRQQRQELLHCLFAVAAADGEISGEEEEQVRQIADELGLTHREFAAIRSTFNDQRAVMRRLQS